MNESEDVSVMFNEEDHARIQSIFPGDNLDAAYAAANRTDAAIEKNSGSVYAFDQEFGYLTACPTNAGTGMRASLMLHLPELESSGAISQILHSLGKLSMTIRGIHGEGSEGLGSVFQVSNQSSLGKTEEEIIQNLKLAVGRVVSSEMTARGKAYAESKHKTIDMIHRSYGILKHCRRLGHKEGMALLSNIRTGFMMGWLETKKPKKTIYSLMMNIQPGSICAMAGKPMNREERAIYRAEYVRNELV